jgi:hypothetical protein
MEPIVDLDVKLQLYRGEAGPEKVDQRKSTGAFVGSPEDEHRTVLEGRITEEDLAELEMSKDELFDNLVSANKILAILARKQHPATGSAASLLGLGGQGPVKAAIRAYDAD